MLGKRNGSRTLPLLALIAVPVALAGCGGGGTHAARKATAAVTGSGFRFDAPAGWVRTSTATTAAARRGATGGPAVSATAFTLLKPYSPKLFAKAAKELDGVAEKLAAQSNSSLTERTTVVVDGEKVRAYRLTVHPASGASFDERIGFVLIGKREYQLLCRAPVGSGDPDGACALLYSSFTTTK